MRIGLLLIVCFLVGCTSRWAMDDPEYAAKYGKPYEPDNKPKKIQRMAKQLVDARHAQNESGKYTELSYQPYPGSAGIELGLVEYSPAWWSGRGGISLLGGTGDVDLFVGLNLGTRMQLPSRLAPFVGVGAYGGLSAVGILAASLSDTDSDPNDPFQQQRQRRPEEEPEEKEEFGTYAAIYPEIGWHFWPKGACRLTVSTRYMFSTDGRDSDGWMFTVSLSRFGDGIPNDCEITYDLDEHGNPIESDWKDVASGEAIYQESAHAGEDLEADSASPTIIKLNVQEDDSPTEEWWKGRPPE